MPSSGVQTCARSEEHTSELQSHSHLVCRLLLEKKKNLHHAQVLHALSPCAVGAANIGREEVFVPTVFDSPAPVCRYGLFDRRFVFFFFNDTAPPEIYPLSLHDALPI